MYLYLGIYFLGKHLCLRGDYTSYLLNFSSSSSLQRYVFYTHYAIITKKNYRLNNSKVNLHPIPLNFQFSLLTNTPTSKTCVPMP